MADLMIAEKGKIWVLTEAGLRQSQLKGTEKVKEDCRTGKRAVGKPVGKYTYAVPRRWVTQGWVEEAWLKETEDLLDALNK